MELRFFGHSCFSVTLPGHRSPKGHACRLLFDPFLTDNPSAASVGMAADSMEADVILLSHGHFDHVQDAPSIAIRTGARVVANFEVGEWLKGQGVPPAQVIAMNHGGTVHLDSCSVQMVSAVHSSTMPDGSSGGTAAGFVVRSASGAFYYSGDTALTLDMQLIARKGPLSFAVLCVGDHFTMGPEEAAEAAVMVGAKEVVGVHFDTWPPLKVDHAAAQKVFHSKGVKLSLLTPGADLRFE